MQIASWASERARPLYSPPFFQLHKWSMNESRKYAGASCKWGVLVYMGAAPQMFYRYSQHLGLMRAFMGYFAPFPHSSLSLACAYRVEKRGCTKMMPAAAEIAAIVIFCWINGPDAFRTTRIRCILWDVSDANITSSLFFCLYWVAQKKMDYFWQIINIICTPCLLIKFSSNNDKFVHYYL